MDSMCRLKRLSYIDIMGNTSEHMRKVTQPFWIEVN